MLRGEQIVGVINSTTGSCRYFIAISWWHSKVTLHPTGFGRWILIRQRRFVNGPKIVEKNVLRPLSAHLAFTRRQRFRRCQASWNFECLAFLRWGLRRISGWSGMAWMGR